jgi:hypothetical protein
MMHLNRTLLLVSTAAAVTACGTVGLAPTLHHTAANLSDAPDAGASTTPASGLPSAPPCDPSMPGGRSAVRPTALFIGCATSADNVDQLVWTTWTGTAATGSGRHNVNSCQPDCAEGKLTSYAVSVALSNPGYVQGIPDFAGVYIFRTLTLAADGKAGGEMVTIPPGNWGFVAGG